MTVAEKAVDWAVATAGNPINGYDQINRWGVDYDCSSFVITAYEKAGIPVKSKGGATYTGNMRNAFLNCGFKEVDKSGLRLGDVLLNEKNHTAIYIGGGKIVHARINENGTTTGGQTGDQTGGEICVTPYYDYPWDCVLRYEGATQSGGMVSSRPTTRCTVTLPVLSEGMISNAVRSMQILLIHRWGISCGSYGDDGEFGAETKRAVLQFQNKMHLEEDGIAGEQTLTKLIT